MTNLARIRKSSGISQKELANLCGISIKTIQAYEQRLKDINRAEVKTLFKISQILMVDINVGNCSIEMYLIMIGVSYRS